MDFTLYIIIGLVLIIGTILLLSSFDWAPAASLTIIGFIAWVACGLAIPCGLPVSTYYDYFSVTRGKNSILVEVNDKTLTFSDAQSYNNYSKIYRVEKRQDKNIWGAATDETYILNYK